MTTRRLIGLRRERGVGLMEVMISIVIGMLLVLVIYQVFQISESQKRTITAGSDAQQNASYGLFVLGRELSMAGNGLSSAATELKDCPFDDATPELSLAPMPVLITGGGAGNVPDAVTVFYGGSSSLSTAVQFKNTASTSQPYVVPGPVGFSANADPNKTDVIVAVQGANCTLSTINAGGVAVDVATGFSTLSHTPVVGAIGSTYSAVSAFLVNLGPAGGLGRIAFTVDTTTHALRTQKLLPTADANPVPIIGDVVNLKVQYGLDTIADNNAIVDTWTEATGQWTPAALALLSGANRLAKERQILAVRIAIVTRSTQWEIDPVTRQCIALTPGPIMMLDDTVTMNLTGNEPCYRYKVLETIVPLRNALWNAS